MAATQTRQGWPSRRPSTQPTRECCVALDDDYKGWPSRRPSTQPTRAADYLNVVSTRPPQPNSRRSTQPTLAADYLNGVGKHFGALSREGKAPNQTTQALAPPKTMARVTGTREDGTPQFKAGRQFRGVNAIIVRASCEAIGTNDPRVATVRSVNQTKENLGERGRSIKSVNPETGDRPKAIVLRSNRQQRQSQRHEEDGQGYDKDGQMGPVKAGDPKRDEHGHALQDTYEGQTTYRAYHASDLNIDKMPEDRPPMSGEWADKYVAAKMEERAEAAGEPVREATAEERTAILIERQMEKRCDMAELDGVQFESAERDDYSFGVNAEGTAVIQVPAADNPDVSLDQSYTSLAVACAHAEQHRSATDALARDAAPDGDINLSDERRGELERLVEAYSLPEAERATNPDFSRAELVATYSAVTEVTGHGGQYEAPESTRSDYNREQWAKELSAPGGFERVGLDINRAEEALAERMPRQQASPEQVQQRQQERTEDTSRSIHDVMQSAQRDARTVQRARSSQPDAPERGAAPAPVPDRADPAGVSGGPSRGPDGRFQSREGGADRDGASR